MVQIMNNERGVLSDVKIWHKFFKEFYLFIYKLFCRVKKKKLSQSF